MILSIKHNFVFIHTVKCAGTSIEEFFRSQGIGEQDKIGDQPIAHHCRAHQVRKILGPQFFNRLFSFAIVRNPWDWCYSQYNYYLRKPNHHLHEATKKFQDYNHYLKFAYYKHLEESPPEQPGLPFGQLQLSYTSSPTGVQIVSFVGRFENLEQDFQTALERIGLSKGKGLPRKNVSTKGDFRSAYTSETVDYIAEMYARDIECFGYRFE